MTTAHDDDGLMDVAIVGMSCRLPGAPTAQAYWDNLVAGRESVETLDEAALREAGVDDATLADPAYVRAGAFVADFDCFDATFFGFSPREAALTDPQHRLFLETCWAALEDAGCTAAAHEGSVGVFGGTAMNGYLLHNVATRPDLAPNLFDFQIQIANDKDYLATRVSHRLGLRGPSLAVQSACSTSLVAVHVACQSLLAGECRVALAGGVAIAVPHRVGYHYREGGVHSRDGHCRAFDAQASGAVFGSGVGVVVLKRLTDALADEDHVYAVIKGSAVNNDGSGKIGYTAPAPEGQAAVIAEAQSVAGVTADEIGYVETHGTGTLVGDPIEIQALTRAFRETSRRTGYCAIGSVKTNVGHLDVASGIAGLIKAALAIHHGVIPASLHFTQPNPEIDFAASPFFVNVANRAWPAGRRLAGVSSFGLGGTNAHVILGEAPPRRAASGAPPHELVVLSARSEAALERMRERLTAHLAARPDLPLADVAWTLQAGREAHAHRLALACDSTADLRTALDHAQGPRVHRGVAREAPPRVVFMFPGQGAQYPGMGRDLWATAPVFRETFDRCAELLHAPLGCDLREVVCATPDDAAAARLQETRFAQPALFAFSYALARQWMHWGVVPDALIGHSIGEYVAACLAGILSLEDAAALVALRGQLMQSMPRGAMIEVDLPEAEARRHAAGTVSVATVNTPSRCVLSGETGAIEALERQLAAAGQQARRLRTSHAFHSAMMDPALAPFADRVRQLARHAPTIPLVSNVSGTWLTDAEALDPGYYARHLRETVRFADGLRTLATPDTVLLEVGPGRSLQSFARQTLGADAVRGIASSVRHADQEGADDAVLLAALGQIWTLGVAVDWWALRGGDTPLRVPLPTYPFERTRHWIEPRRLAHGAADVPVPSERSATAGKLELSKWFHRTRWQARPLTVTPAAAGERHWLLLAAGNGLAAAVASGLAARGARATVIDPGAQPGDETAWERLFAAQATLRGGVAEVVVEWPAIAGEPDEATGADADAVVQACLRLVRIVRALSRTGASGQSRLTVVSIDGQAIDDADPVCPAAAVPAALCTVIGQEFPGIDTSVIDLSSRDLAGSGADAAGAGVADELLARAGAFAVGLRRGARWERDFSAVAFPRDTGDDLFRAGGTYLVTGGLGNIGYTIAEHLARVYRCNLILTGRTSLPDRPDWEGTVADAGAPASVRERTRRALALEALGARVAVIAADAADAGAMRAGLAGIRERFGRVDGVIHGAGIVADEAFVPVEELDAHGLETHFGPKIGGLAVLAALPREEPPAFVILLSSISAVLGGLGYAAYAGANAYLDAFALASAGRFPATRWLSIGWDAWDFESAPAQRHGFGAVSASLSLTPPEGVDVFCRLARTHGHPHVIVSTGDLGQRVAQWVRVPSPAPVPDAGGAAAAADVAPAGPGAGPDTDMQAAIAAIWKEVLGVGHVEVTDNFFDIGGDSLLLMNAIARVKTRFGIVLNPREIMFQSLGQVAALCESRLVPSPVAGAPGDEPRPKRGLFGSLLRRTGIGAGDPRRDQG